MESLGQVEEGEMTILSGGKNLFNIVRKFLVKYQNIKLI